MRVRPTNLAVRCLEELTKRLAKLLSTQLLQGWAKDGHCAGFPCSGALA